MSLLLIALTVQFFVYNYQMCLYSSVVIFIPVFIKMLVDQERTRNYLVINQLLHSSVNVLHGRVEAF